MDVPVPPDHSFAGHDSGHTDILLPTNPLAPEADTWKMPALATSTGPVMTVPTKSLGGTVIRSVISLVIREGLLRVVILVANVVLARLLTPSVFGIFVVLQFFNSFLSTFGLFGLGAAIVQREQNPSDTELGSLVGFQTVMSGLLVLLAFVASPYVANLYHLGTQGEWLIRAMAIGFFLTSFSATPMALLERRLAFGRVAVIEVTAGVVFEALAVGMAWTGFGIWSLVAATLASGVTSMIATYVACGWWPRFSLHWRPIWPVVRFGMHYQVNSIISLLKDNISPTFVIAVVGAAAVGYINWASTLAYYPMIIVDLIGRVTFPAYARSIHDRSLFQQLLESTIRAQCYVILPMIIALATLAPYITHVIFTDKWMPAVPLVYFMLVSTLLSAVSRPLIAAINALGKPDVVAKLMIMWFVLDWACIVPLVLRFGFVGYAVANAIVSLTIVVTVYLVKRYQEVQMLRNVMVPIALAAITGGIFYFVTRHAPPTTIVPLVLDGIGICLVYAVLEVVLDRHFMKDMVFIMASFRTRGKQT